ncbi:MAG: hypothetical protein A4E71_00526 [Smithella sp. PtaU1.Bin162]|nr:MAG: hypothetical protein A4E71_00526 [Smithella sp. PtaU1.Bin162]
MKCIYCLQKDNSKFKNREHVLPQSFGKFRNNLVLNGIVCDDCNEFFGKNLEVALARDTYEGSVARYKFGIKPVKEFKFFGKNSQIITKIEDGALKGAYAYREYDKNSGKIVIKPVPQVGFLKSGTEEYDFFPLDKIPSAKFFDNKRYCIGTEKGFAVLGCDQESANKALQDKGYFLMGEAARESITPGQSRMFGRIDQTIMRAVAKIGFNYLASQEGPDFVLRSDFDSIRKYIRYGESLSHSEPFISKEAITPDEKIDGYRRLGHVILINRMPNSSAIYAFVSLFNLATYSFCLTENISDSRDVIVGHLFRISDGEIEKFNLRRSRGDEQ